jgi:hypothetical protein
LAAFVETIEEKNRVVLKGLHGKYSIVLLIFPHGTGNDMGEETELIQFRQDTKDLVIVSREITHVRMQTGTLRLQFVARPDHL